MPKNKSSKLVPPDKKPRGKPVKIPVDFDKAMDVFANEPPPNKKKDSKDGQKGQ